MKISTFFTRFFTWWNGQTFGTQVWTALYGEFVGEDEFGNRYYRTKGGKIDPVLGFERRWVIYNGYAEASAIGPAWHGWIHHIVDVPPTEEKYTARPWQKPHRPNPTGTPAAQRPTGSTLALGRRPRATGDLDIWIDAAPPNAPRVMRGLAAFGAPTEDITALDFARPGIVFQIGVPPGRLDILTPLTRVRAA